MCQSTLLPASEIGIIISEQSEGIFQSSCHMLVSHAGFHSRTC